YNDTHSALAKFAGAAYFCGLDPTFAAGALRDGTRNGSRKRPPMSEPPTSVHRAKAHDVLEAARSWLDKDGRIALATVIGTWGSAPVGVGGQMVVAPDGRFEGSVSGGCVEGEVIAEAEDILSNGR